MKIKRAEWEQAAGPQGTSYRLPLGAFESSS